MTMDAVLGNDSQAVEPVHVSISLPMLKRVLAALEAGLEAAKGEHGAAILQYEGRRPLRVKWYAEQVELIESAIVDLRGIPLGYAAEADRAERGELGHG